jgi:methylated-DNA-[protein]-cysteine S-methyltransferase
MQTLMSRVVFGTPFGECAVAWQDGLLTGFELPTAAAQITDEPAPPAFISAMIARVQRHLSGDFQDFSDLSFDFSKTPEFQTAVLQATLAVKAGQTRSYGQIATDIGGQLGVSRAVGAALGANRWPLLIPCHRIVAATGKMTGFSGPGGVKTKLRLLALEGAQLFAD